MRKTSRGNLPQRTIVLYFTSTAIVSHRPTHRAALIGQDLSTGRRPTIVGIEIRCRCRSGRYYCFGDLGPTRARGFASTGRRRRERRQVSRGFFDADVASIVGIGARTPLLSYVIVVAEADPASGQLQPPFVDDEVGHAALDAAMPGFAADKELAVGR